ncbi:hypothetical protein WA556_005451 [Blastocystis sp. ATCC 50177/Nand II]
MNNASDLTIVLTPSDSIKMELVQGEQATTTISVLNPNEQKIIVKLRSNAGKKIRIRNGSFALDSQQSITLEVKIHPKVVDELLKGYMESKTFESYRLQFIITGISDLLYDRISTADEEAQSALLAKQWEETSKLDTQQTILPVTFFTNAVVPPTLEERKSEESLTSLVSTDVFTHPEYKRLKTQYDAICVIVKRCQDLVKKQQEEKEELEKKLKVAEGSLAAVKEEQDLDLSASKHVLTRVKPSTLSGISVFGFVIAFIVGFILGQFVSRFIK